MGRLQDWGLAGYRRSSDRMEQERTRHHPIEVVDDDEVVGSLLQLQESREKSVERRGRAHGQMSKAADCHVTVSGFESLDLLHLADECGCLDVFQEEEETEGPHRQGPVSCHCCRPAALLP